ncbi:hypothetical protein SDC9_210224 [bioreactor metagenome]|uniref:Uncharacterized protein n=1 Tax=bioreactor metagenome TaxID=1076179 RepID=A0A645JFK2_9ZZZZ
MSGKVEKIETLLGHPKVSLPPFVQLIHTPYKQTERISRGEKKNHKISGRFRLIPVHHWVDEAPFYRIRLGKQHCRFNGCDDKSIIRLDYRIFWIMNRQKEHIAFSHRIIKHAHQLFCHFRRLDHYHILRLHITPPLPDLPA